MKKSLILSAIAIALAIPGAANAVLLDGKTLNYQYYFEDLDSPYPFADNGDKIVGAGVEVSDVIDGRGTIDISDTNIFVDFQSSSKFVAAEYNGWVMTDVLNDIDPFTSVTINEDTNLIGFSAANLSWTADTISVNWQDLFFDADTIVSLDINSAGAVPEPATWAFMIFGFGAIGAAIRLKRRANMKARYT